MWHQPSPMFIVLLLLQVLVKPVSCLTLKPRDGAFTTTRRSNLAFCSFSRSLNMIPTWLAHRQTHRISAVQLNLFALNLYGGNGKNGNEDENNDDSDDDVPSWVQALRQWPRFPASQPRGNILPTTTAFNGIEEEEERDSLRRQAESTGTGDLKRSSIFSRLRLPVPLSSLAYVEALLLTDRSDEARNAADTNINNRAAYDTTELMSQLSDEPTPTTSQITKSSISVEDDIGTHLKGRSILPSKIWSVLPDIRELGYWDQWMGTMQRSLAGLTSEVNGTVPLVVAADSILKKTTARMEYLVTEISTALSPTTLQELIPRINKTLDERRIDLEANNSSSRVTAKALLESAIVMARQQGLDVREATKLARETTKYASNLVALANNVLAAGFASNDFTRSSSPLQESTSSTTSQPLLKDFDSARVLSSRYSAQLSKASEMGALAGAIYQDTLPRTHALGHTLVANGTTSDVAWMITDSIGYEHEYREPREQRGHDHKDRQSNQKPTFVRTLTIRGYDASDESVDRERLLNTICSATPEPMGRDRVLAHSGLLSVARKLYPEIKKYIAWTAPTHRLVLNGHSAGGSISTLILLLLTEEFGAKFVEEKVLRVFTFGSPPVTTTTYKSVKSATFKNYNFPDSIGQRNLYECDVLREYNLSPFIVYGFVQPWDPIVRLFSKADALFPLVGDLGKDGVTLYASGPPRSLRPIIRKIVESWQGWPLFRDNFRTSCSQNYTSIGIQHVLLPEPLRYLSDRVVGANIRIPPVDSVLRLSSPDLFAALQHTFPLDVFQISFVPAAIRGFVHHFYPAYGFSFVEYAAKLAKTIESSNSAMLSPQPPKKATASFNNDTMLVGGPQQRFLARNGKSSSTTELHLGWTRHLLPRRRDDGRTMVAAVGANTKNR